MKITEKTLRRIIREALSEYDWDDPNDTKAEWETDRDNGFPRFDDYGEQIKKGGQGYGIDSSAANRQGYNADGTKGPWFSRSVAMATAVFLNDNGKWYVLANQRGQGTPDYQGWWNLPCGYLDYNEDALDGARREVYEETGIKIKRSQMKDMGYSSDPRQNRQNVCFRFAAFLKGSPNDYPFSKDNMEQNEVGGIKWVPIEQINTIQWAFGHNRILQDFLNSFKHIMGSQNSEYSAYSCISYAIQLLQNGGNKDEIISTLNNALQQINNTQQQATQRQYRQVTENKKI